jgi:predicted nuclease of restriction endonuclease-like (RecB) superfamily
LDKKLLIYQIEGESYERFLLNQTNFDTTLADKYKHQAKLAVKDSYSFDFLEMSEDYGEREMEFQLMKKKGIIINDLEDLKEYINIIQ